MKRIIALITLTVLASAHAESYKAPKFKLPDAKPEAAKVQKSSWDDESHFKIEESAEAERDLASSPERESDWAKPEDKPAPVPQKKDDARIIPWKMMDKN